MIAADKVEGVREEPGKGSGQALEAEVMMESRKGRGYKLHGIGGLQQSWVAESGSQTKSTKRNAKS